MEEKKLKNQLVAESAKDLWLRFEREFDPGIFESMARKQASSPELPAGWRLLGEGADQTAIGRACGGVEYSMSVPKPSFLEGQGDDGRRWLAALESLRREARHRAFEKGEVTLVPPMHVSTKPPAIIMPVGQLINVAPRDVLENTMKLLSDLGLELTDRPQVAVWRGRPFIYDWSDLRMTPRHQ